MALVLFTDIRKMYKYIYPRTYEYYRESKRKKLLRVNNCIVYVYVTGVPDNVSPYANEAMISKEARRRLYIMSDEPLTINDLFTLDSEYGDKNLIYPIFELEEPNRKLVSIPKNNFFECDGVPSSVSEFLEYRYLLQRHVPCNIAFDRKSKLVYSPFIAPSSVIPKILIMPSNFIITGSNTGYFAFDKIIIRVFSNHLLSGSSSNTRDSGLITDFSTDNVVLVQIVEDFFHELGMINIISNNKDQIIAKDSYLTLVFGAISDLVLPITEGFG